MDFHFLVLSLSENPNFLDYKILVQVKHVHMLDQLKLHHMLVHLIYIHAIEIKFHQDYEHNLEEMDNVEKLKKKERK
jgi:hypothetical protein